MRLQCRCIRAIHCKSCRRTISRLRWMGVVCRYRRFRIRLRDDRIVYEKVDVAGENIEDCLHKDLKLRLYLT
jgi:hypothetical protein